MPAQPQHASTHELLEHLDWVRSLAAQLAFDPQQRGDLEQEIWRAALQSPPAAGVPLRAWLIGIGRNLRAMMQRSASRRRRREQARGAGNEAPSTAALTEEAETQQRLLAAVNALPEAMRDVVLLRHFEDLPPRAIAARLAIPVATVRTRLQRAHERLRQQLDADFGERRAWALACITLARPRHVVAAAGIATTTGHLLLIMHTPKMLVAAAAMLLLAVPAYLMTSSEREVVPAEGHATPIASVVEPRSTAAGDDAGTPRATVVTSSSTNAFFGRVVDRSGAPVAGVHLYRWSRQSAEDRVDDGRAKPGDVSTTSAADGSFTLPPFDAERGLDSLEAEASDYVPLLARTTVCVGEPATIVMLRTHEVPLLVEVHDRTTKLPVPGFEVAATTAWCSDAETTRPNRTLRAPEHARGSDGIYRGVARFVEGMPLELLVTCWGDGRGEWNDGSDVIPRRNLEPKPDVPIHLTFEVDLEAAERIAARAQRGRVVDASTGKAIPGVELAVWDAQQARRYAQSRADGLFVIAMPKNGADGTLKVEHPDYQSVTMRADPEQYMTVRLTPRATFHCRIVDGQGQPLVSKPVLVRVSGDDNLRFDRRLRTDASGGFGFEQLLAGRYDVYVLARASDADERAIASGSYAVAAGEHVDVTLATTPTTAVHVIGTLAGAAPGLVPTFIPHAGNGGPKQARAHGADYDAGELSPGDYLVALIPGDDDQHDAPMALLPRVAVAGAGTVAIDLLMPTGVVRGRVLTQRADRADLRVIAVPVVPASGPAAALLGRAELTRSFGVPLGDDGSFVVPRTADADFELQVRNRATIVARRQATVHGTLDVGDWNIDS